MLRPSAAERHMPPASSLLDSRRGSFHHAFVRAGPPMPQHLPLVRGLDPTWMSSKKARSFSVGSNLLWMASNAACCPTENNGMRGSPCSPPSPWHRVDCPTRVLPQVGRRFRVEQAHKRKCLAPPCHSVQPKQHSNPWSHMCLCH